MHVKKGTAGILIKSVYTYIYYVDQNNINARNTEINL